MKVAGKITRKSMLYETKVEYGDYAMNHVQGCAHGCCYPCYAFLIAKRFKKVSDIDEWRQPLLVENTLDLLQKELPLKASKIKQVQLCFTTDPFMYGYPEIEDVSIKAMQRINAYGIPCVVLTKGVLPTSLTELDKSNCYGITLITLSEDYRREIEPGAAPIEDRIAALKTLSESGCKTWVSIEPYPTPNIFLQDLEPILERISFVDRIVFGRIHYNKNASSYPEAEAFFLKAAEEVMTFCAEYGIDCHIKKGTAD